MEHSELKIADIENELRSITPPVPVTEDGKRIYEIGYMRGATKAIRLCHRDVRNIDYVK